MIETIPNPLQDAGIKKEIEAKVQELLSWQGNHRNVCELITNLLTAAANWGMQTGFRYGWKVHEVEKGGGR